MVLLVGVRSDELWESSETLVAMDGESVIGMLITRSGWMSSVVVLLLGSGGVDGLGGAVRGSSSSIILKKFVNKNVLVKYTSKTTEWTTLGG